MPHPRHFNLIARGQGCAAAGRRETGERDVPQFPIRHNDKPPSRTERRRKWPHQGAVKFQKMSEFQRSQLDRMQTQLILKSA